MMKSARLARLTAQAATAGVRVNRTGNGAFVILYRGQRHLVVNLRAAELVVRQFCGGTSA